MELVLNFRIEIAFTSSALSNEETKTTFLICNKFKTVICDGCLQFPVQMRSDFSLGICVRAVGSLRL